MQNDTKEQKNLAEPDGARPPGQHAQRQAADATRQNGGKNYKQVRAAQSEVAPLRTRRFRRMVAHRLRRNGADELAQSGPATRAQHF